MSTGQSTVASDGASIDLAEPIRLADAATLGDVFEKRLRLRRGEPSVEEGRPPAFGEAGLASPASEHAFELARPVVSGDGQIFGVAFAVLRAGGIQAAEPRQVIHHPGPPMRRSKPMAGCVTFSRMTDQATLCNKVPPRGNYLF